MAHHLFRWKLLVSGKVIRQGLMKRKASPSNFLGVLLSSSQDYNIASLQDPMYLFFTYSHVKCVIGTWNWLLFLDKYAYLYVVVVFIGLNMFGMYMYIYMCILSVYLWYPKRKKNISNLRSLPSKLYKTEAEDADEFQSGGNPSWCFLVGFLGCSVQFGYLVICN